VRTLKERISLIVFQQWIYDTKGNSMKLMLIDDELPILESLERALKPTGYVCATFQSSRKALEAYRQESCDVVVTDFMMPELNGIEVLKEIKTIDPEARVIILTGYADIDNAIAAVNNGAYAFFRKPLNFRDFISTLKKIDQEIKGKLQKEVDMQKFQEEYSRLRNAFESLQDMVREMGGKLQEKTR
jgi:DNA-binding NtrC family response regulator